MMTVKEILALGPCWDKERVTQFAGVKKEWTGIDVLGIPDDAVDRGEKLWLLWRDEYLTDDQRTEVVLGLIEEELRHADNYRMLCQSAMDFAFASVGIRQMTPDAERYVLEGGGALTRADEQCSMAAHSLEPWWKRFGDTPEEERERKREERALKQRSVVVHAVAMCVLYRDKPGWHDYAINPVSDDRLFNAIAKVIRKKGR